MLCLLWPKILNGADIAFDIEGHISLVAAAIPYDLPVSNHPNSLFAMRKSLQAAPKLGRPWLATIPISTAAALPRQNPERRRLLHLL
jgi:hypothetical protein